MANTHNPRRREDVQAEDLPDGSTLLFDPTNLMTYPISSSASLVWRVCDGRHSKNDIADQIESEYEVDHETAEKDVAKLLEDFDKLGLLQDESRGARVES